MHLNKLTDRRYVKRRILYGILEPYVKPDGNIAEVIAEKAKEASEIIRIRIIKYKNIDYVDSIDGKQIMFKVSDNTYDKFEDILKIISSDII